MSVYKLTGKAKLSGKVSLQGAKNSAMKYMFLPLIANDKFIIRNVPNISSTKKLAELTKQQGATVKWIDSNTVEIDTTNILESKIISEELVYHTSGAVLCVPILVNKFGRCEIEINLNRDDTGGDQIGRMSMAFGHDQLSKLGVKITQNKNRVVYELIDKSPFKYEVPNESFGATIGALFGAIFRDGESTIINPCKVSEFEDIVRFLQAMGAEIHILPDKLIIKGNKPLHGIDFTNMYDKHDFITFLTAALVTESEITIEDVEYEKMKLDCLEDFLKQANIRIEFDNQNNTALIPAQKLSNLKPVNIIAKEYPHFVTEWQVLISPLLALIKGESQVIEAYHMNRLRHWEELEKMGAKYHYFSDLNYPEQNNNPRCVKITGIDELYGSQLESKDVRSGATMILAGLAANGTTIVNDPQDHISRGYEDLDKRLRLLGADINI